MIGRTEQCSAQFTARDVCEMPFDRLRLGDIDLIKIGLGKAKGVALEKLPIDRDGAVFSKLKKRPLRRPDQLNIVTSRFLQKEPRERKERVRDRAGFDLGDDILKS